MRKHLSEPGTQESGHSFGAGGFLQGRRVGFLRRPPNWGWRIPPGEARRFPTAASKARADLKQGQCWRNPPEGPRRFPTVGSVHGTAQRCNALVDLRGAREHMGLRAALQGAFVRMP